MKGIKKVEISKDLGYEAAHREHILQMNHSRIENIDNNDNIDEIVLQTVEESAMTKGGLKSMYLNRKVISYTKEELLEIINNLDGGEAINAITVDTLPMIIETIKKDTGMTNGEKIALLAKIINCPEAINNIVEGTTPGWGHTMTPQTFEGAELYNKVHNIVENIINDYSYGSCAQALATVVIAIYDPSFPYIAPGEQLNYLNNPNNNKWENVGIVKPNQGWGDIQEGDVVISNSVDGHQHAMICAGKNENSNPLFYEAAATDPEGDTPGFSMYPIISEKSINDDYYGRSYTVFRAK